MLCTYTVHDVAVVTIHPKQIFSFLIERKKERINDESL